MSGEDLKRQTERLEHFQSIIHTLEGAGKAKELIDAAAATADRQKQVLQILWSLGDGDDPMVGPDPESAARAISNRIASSYKHSPWYREYNNLKSTVMAK